jgi:maltose alpha-D-glucosyltransferase/alpha-amylase
VLAFTRSDERETMLCVMNLANTPRAATVRLPGHAGASLTDVFGGGSFPAVGHDGTVSVTLGSRDFFWLQVSRSEGAGEASRASGPAQVRPSTAPTPQEPPSAEPRTAQTGEVAGPAHPEGTASTRPDTYVVPTSTSAPRAPTLPPHQPPSAPFAGPSPEVPAAPWTGLESDPVAVTPEE